MAGLHHCMIMISSDQYFKLKGINKHGLKTITLLKIPPSLPNIQNEQQYYYLSQPNPFNQLVLPPSGVPGDFCSFGMVRRKVF